MSDINKKIEEFEKKNANFPQYIIDSLKKNIPKNLSEKEINMVLENVEKEYMDSQVSAYEAIGIITAQSIGEPATQMTLNTFHFAGVSAQSVEGLPRIIEIMDLKKTQSNPYMKIYVTKEYQSEEKIKKVVDKIKELKLKNFVKKVDLNIQDKIVSFEVDFDGLNKLDIDKEKIVSLLDKKYTKRVSFDKNTMSIQENQNSGFKDLLNLQEQVLSIVVYGIVGISDVTIIKENNELIIFTKGIALKKAMKIEGVDLSRIYCNDIIEIYSNFGIEAARETIIREILEVCNNQGLSVNQRHLTLIADLMTSEGVPKGMTRFGIVANKLNILTKASFETPIKHLSNGSLLEEENHLNSITENVMTNQMIYVGTGMPKIKVKDRK